MLSKLQLNLVWNTTSNYAIFLANGYIQVALFVWVKLSDWNFTPFMVNDWCNFCYILDTLYLDYHTIWSNCFQTILTTSIMYLKCSLLVWDIKYIISSDISLKYQTKGLDWIELIKTILSKINIVLASLNTKQKLTNALIPIRVFFWIWVLKLLSFCAKLLQLFNKWYLNKYFI